MTSIKRSTTPERSVSSSSSSSSMIPAINRINQSSALSFGCNNNTGNSTSYLTPRSIRSRNGTFQSFPIVHTPTPPSRFKRIINPFEVNLVERLQQPSICSPSLFHRSETPKHCSTPTRHDWQGWTIDEVSLLNPANIEPHESQFISHIDPDSEAQVQAAISTYFIKEHNVLSPDVTEPREQQQQQQQSQPLITHDTPSSSQIRKRWRSTTTQTELTLPPILPPDLEAALKPYFTHTQEQGQQQSPPDGDDGDATMNSVFNDTTIDHEARDASLRRKLFHNSPTSSEVSSTDYQQVELNLDSPAPQTPDMMMKLGYSRMSLGGSDIQPDDAFGKLDEIFSDNYDDFAEGIFDGDVNLIDDDQEEDGYAEGEITDDNDNTVED